MTGICDGRVVIVTGAGRGIGRQHTLEFARQGAHVVVNDVGAEVDGGGTSIGPASDVVEEIRSMGRRAAVNGDDVADRDGAERLISSALDEFGRLDVLVNNAGILRDRMLVNMSFEEWDAVIRVHRGTFGPTHFAAVHWRERAKAGDAVDARIINTSSPSGLYGNVGQSNYGAAKAGIASFTVITAMELARYGVTVNAIAPAAATRMTIPLRGAAGREPTKDVDGFDPSAPENISPLVVWLGSARSADVTGRVFNVRGGRISVAEGWRRGPGVSEKRRWDPADLDEVIGALLADADRTANGEKVQLMPLNLDAVGATSEPTVRTWTSRDTLLYAVAVGAGADDVTQELEFTTENSHGVDQKVLPTFAVILGMGARGHLKDLGAFNPAMLVHAEQSVELHRPIPANGSAVVTSTLVDIVDKGSGALVVSETRAIGETDGASLFSTRSAFFIHGEGGFATGERPRVAQPAAAEGDPDIMISASTLAHQALIYRLCGDRNPLHSDPRFAERAGFERPILHGLCTYGFAGRALLSTLCNSDPGRFRSMAGRFTKPVMPGQNLRTAVWKDEQAAAEGEKTAWFRTMLDDGTVVIDRGRCTYV